MISPLQTIKSIFGLEINDKDPAVPSGFSLR